MSEHRRHDRLFDVDDMTGNRAPHVERRARQVGADAKRLVPRRGDNGDFIFTVVETAPRGLESSPHIVVHRVELFGAIQGDDSYVVLGFVKHHVRRQSYLHEIGMILSSSTPS